MKVVIFCGGKGTRLGEVTGNLIPKPMALIGNEPILLHIMRIYAAFGCREFILCVGHLSWSIKSYFLEFRARRSDVTVSTAKPFDVVFHGNDVNEDWKVTIVDTGLETGTAARLNRVKQYIEPDETFMLTYGDGVSDVNLHRLEAFHRAHGKLVTMTGVIPPGRFGELSLKGNKVVNLAEKPNVSDRYINGGFMVMQREFIQRFIANKDDSVMLEREPLVEATDAGELMLFRHGGFWQCMDTARDWDVLNKMWESGDAPWLEARN